MARYLFGLLLLFTMLTSQNCAKNEDSFAQYASDRGRLALTPGTVTAPDHDRSVFLRRPLGGGLCPDGGSFETKIIFNGADPILIRDQCQDLNASAQRVVEVSFVADRDDLLIYQTQSLFLQPNVDEILAAIPPPPPASGPVRCLNAGASATFPLPLIDYRKCNGELEVWADHLKTKCCSQSVLITDQQSFSDILCSDGRFEGRAVCN